MKYLKILLLILISNPCFAQNNFELKIESKDHVKDSLWFGMPRVRTGFTDLFQFKLDENKNVENLSKKIGFSYSIYSLKIDNETILKGKIDYPQPVGLMYKDPKDQTFFATTIFFIEKGKYQINLPKISNGLPINIKTPTHLEYLKLKNYLSPVYLKYNDLIQQDSLIDFNKKQEMLGQYIKENPNSYVALWEIVDDYSLYDYDSNYLVNMKLFSKEMKKSLLYKKIESKLIAESKSLEGQKIPTIYFDKNQSLSEKDFKNHKLTFIDYWSTSCSPCIKGMPKIVQLYNDFKDRGVNFLSITDESKSDRIKTATRILDGNNAFWKNYFDINRDFGKKVNATAYPLHFIIDADGIIIARIEGDIDEARKIITEIIN